MLYYRGRQRIVDANGDGVSNAKVYFYDSLTSTLAPVYTDAERTVEHTNPVRTNAAGFLPPIYLNPGVLYKTIATTADDVSLPDGTVDPLQIFDREALGAILYPLSDAERNEGVEPVDFSYRWGSFQRYGMDPTGATDSAAALADAMAANSHVFDEYPGGGTYLFNSEVVIPHANIRISGVTRNIQSPVGSGTTFVLATVAGSGAACLRESAVIQTADGIEHICFTWQTYTTGQIGIRCSQLRASRIKYCSFVGTGVLGTSVGGIQIDGTGTYTGDMNISENYFSAVQFGIDARGVCTSLRIRDNEFYGNVTGGNVGFAVRFSSTCAACLVEGNYIQGFDTGIVAVAGSSLIKQIGNTFEANTISWQWDQNATDFMGHVSKGDTIVSGGLPVVPYNNTAGCHVDSQPAIVQYDNTTIKAYRGFQEFGRSARIGYWTNVAYSAGNFTANGGSTWTVDSGDQTTYQYTQVGNTMFVSLTLESTATTVAGPTQLIITIPASVSAAKKVEGACVVNIGGTMEMGKFVINASGTQIVVSRINGASFGTATIDLGLQAQLEMA